MATGAPSHFPVMVDFPWSRSCHLSIKNSTSHAAWTRLRAEISVHPLVRVLIRSVLHRRKMATPEGRIYLRPEFKITAQGDSGEVKKYLVQFSQRVKEGIENGKESGTLSYDFIWKEDDTLFQCIEAYNSPKALADHMENTSNLVEGLLALGVELVGCEMIGTKQAISDQSMREKCAGFNPEYFIQE